MKWYYQDEHEMGMDNFLSCKKAGTPLSGKVSLWVSQGKQAKSNFMGFHGVKYG